MHKAYHAIPRHTLNVENDHSVNIGHDRTETVKNDKTLRVEGKHKETITNDHEVILTEGNASYDVEKGNIFISAMQDGLFQVGTHLSISSGDFMQITSGDTMTIGGTTGVLLTNTEEWLQRGAMSDVTLSSIADVVLKAGDSSITLTQDGPLRSAG